tara:strand:- start:643 stop:1503 length:861 start_codon:yes stop_codon:yes gene_type:complete
MKYIVFENTENYEDSIVLIADKNIKTIENPDNNIKAGYGNYKIHEPSGGLVFDNLRLLRHFFEGARDVFGEGDSCYGSPTDDEKMKRKTMTCFIYEFLTASHIKREMELEGGLNVGLYYIEDDQDSETYNSYLDYINFIERELHLKKSNKPEEGKVYALTGGVGDKCIANGDSWKDSVVQNDEPKTFKIIRFFKDDDRPNIVLLTGLTFEQAQNHCQDPDTSGDGWFDGYESDVVQNDEPQDFEGHCPKCDSDNLDNVSGGVEYTDMACDDCGHKFGIECKGWVIS